MTRLSDGQTKDVKVLIGTVIVIAIPFILTLLSITQPRLPMSVPAEPLLNPSPHGYTWSLSLFVVPDAVLAWWVLSMHRGLIEKKAFWLTLAILVPTWCLLDIFLGLTFFRFPNAGASVGHVWGYTFDAGWQKGIPVEEFGFYVFGFIAMLLVYIWSDEYLLAAYKVERPRTAAGIMELVSFHPRSLITGIVLFALGWAYKAYGPHDYHAGFPGYLLFILSASIMPSILFYRVAKPFINWRALMLTLFFILFLSLFWEAAVGVPYQWWDYNRGQMIGVFIGAFTGLPLEAVVIWLFATWTTVIIYETVHTFLRMGIADVETLLASWRTQEPAT